MLRKSNVSDIDWTLLRPISVAGMLYRIWARMRTKQFLAHCSTFKTSLVSPSLSTRGVWCYLADKLDSTYAQGHRLCGVDIIKCFNAVHRRTLYKAMLRLGFCPNVLGAWFQALKQLVRSVLIDGFSYGHASSCTSVPERDPLSAAAMFCLSFWYSRFTNSCSPNAIPACYADNWESVFPHVDQLALYFPKLEDFLEALRLPVNPAKCWTWSLDPGQRKLLRQIVWCGSHLPVKLQARELGADVSYCLRKAARVRNSRVQATHQRLLRLGGLPGSKAQKQRLLLSGVWPRAGPACCGNGNSAPHSLEEVENQSILGPQHESKR